MVHNSNTVQDFHSLFEYTYSLAFVPAFDIVSRRSSSQSRSQYSLSASPLAYEKTHIPFKDSILQHPLVLIQLLLLILPSLASYYYYYHLHIMFPKNGPGRLARLAASLDNANNDPNADETKACVRVTIGPEMDIVSDFVVRIGVVNRL